MTITEFVEEFKVKYNSASYGAPELNSYEISLFLTQAVRDIVKEFYASFESSEYIKEALSPLIETYEICRSSITPGGIGIALIPVENHYNGIITQEVSIPNNLWFILQENVTYAESELPNSCSINVEVVPEDLDNLNKTMRNPFKKPKINRVIRTQKGNRKVNLHTIYTIECYTMTYLKKYTPIITANFEDDPDLIGNETIDGVNTVRNTELPVFLHDDIVKRGVILAIKSLRENNLKTQIEV